MQGQRWHGRSARHEKAGEASQRERCEAEILRLYLHCPSYRGAIRQELRRRELEDFALQHHRLLWSEITDLEEGNLGSVRLESISRGQDRGDELADLDLPRLLTDQLLLENSDLVGRLTPLLEPGELQRVALARPMEQLRGTAAMLERQKSHKRCRHLLEAWTGQRLETLERCIAVLIDQERDQTSTEVMDMEQRIQSMFEDLNAEALRFQELYYSERRHIQHLDQQRCAGYTPEAKPQSGTDAAVEPAPSVNG